MIDEATLDALAMHGRNLLAAVRYNLCGACRAVVYCLHTMLNVLNEYKQALSSTVAP